MAERRTVLPNASVDALSIGISSSTNCEPPSDAEAKRTMFIGVVRNSAKLGGCLPIELKLGGERPDPITVSDVYFLLFERPVHLASQLVEKLAHGAVIKIASVLRKNLAGEGGDPLAMACGPSSTGLCDLARTVSREGLAN